MNNIGTNTLTLAVPLTRHVQRGFTLIEVMMALAIVAIALSAVSRTMGMSVSNQAQLETKVAATWLAQNELLRVQLMPGLRSEAVQTHDFMGRTWQSELTTEPTLLPGVVKAQMRITEQHVVLQSESKSASQRFSKTQAHATLVSVVGE
ncbi:type II secretion system minor pseudopilin GspI [Thiomicrorhabdus aquaedulcis]|uniref:type II secretion system minor pseudopilin GspI n=1 Tax=Thiomicrorhabdus aquaedulcis TaxID=2211106 RepID=UPI000FD7314D|nr:type II secretion system minor pseudopilin GspI [Thiomicrorhabdus aquaedulcis]